MKRLCLALALVAASVLLATRPAGAQPCSIGGHNETSENFTAAGGWTVANMSPGIVVGAPSAPHLVFSEIAVRGAGTGAASDSSEYIEIYNPTTKPVSLDDKYVSDDLGYYKVVNGPFPVVNTSDFCLKFPNGLSLLPGKTLILCVTKAGFAGSGASPGPAQYFLEMRDSNANTTDDMVNVATGSTFPLTGGMLTNASTTNGEWVVLFCWNGVSDLVCDIDYSSWGANSASNPKMDKSGISIDGPDAGAVPSAYNSDIAAATQSNLGTAALVKPNTYQRVAGEDSEVPLGGNGCLGRVVVSSVNWVPVPNPTGGTNIRFHVRWQNPDDDAPSSGFTGQMFSQEFGVFLPDMGMIGQFNVPPLQPNSFFDVFFEVPLAALPPAPQKIYPGNGGGGAGASMTTASVRGPLVQFDCPPDTNWAGNVDIFWSGSGQGGQVNKHYADLRTCAGGAPSYIHVRGSNCALPMPWTVSGLCPGFGATLVNEDLTPAPNPVPVGWSGFIKVTAGPVPSGTSCCFGITFTCDTQSSTIDVCTTACDCGVNPPKLTSVDWVPVGSAIRFHQHWTNENANKPTDPASGDMSSQAFGVFQSNFGPIGHFDVPPIAPNSFFDVFFDVPLANLPPQPAKMVPGGAGATIVETSAAQKFPTTNFDCPPDTNWAGNVDIQWTAAGQPGSVNKHFADLRSCIGGAPSFIHFRPSNCTAPMPWSITGICPGFSVTLVNEDFTPAPNPVPVGWSGWISVSVAGAVPSGTSCCFSINFGCLGANATIDICSTACDCGVNPPKLTQVDWTPVGTAIRFHQHWTNENANKPTDPASGDMSSQAFGVFQSNFGPIGHFDVPPIAPNSFFDVFFDVPLANLPPQPQKIVPNSATTAQTASATKFPGTNTDCPPDTNWAGNVDIQWTAAGQPGSVNKHFADLRTCIGGAPSFIHFRPSNCTAPMPWSITGVCPGFSVTLVNEDFTPAPNPVPVGWSGWISVSVAGAVPSGTSCCFSLNFGCLGGSATIDICTTACICGNHPPTLSNIDWTTSGGVVTFHQHWTNPDPAMATEPVSGNMNSQMFGVFLPNFGPIGSFSVPAIAPGSFFDVFIDAPLSALPPNPAVTVPGGNPPAGTPCYMEDHWHGNVNVDWAGGGAAGTVGKHFGEMPLCAGGPPTTLFVETGCGSALGASWSITGLCPGYTATLLNVDNTPAPNPLPLNWVGLIAVTAPAGTPVGTTCCFSLNFLCDGVAATIDVCTKVCQCARPQPTLSGLDWTLVGTAVRFHMRWDNPSTMGDSDPVSGTMNSQPFGAFAPDFGPIGQFNVPPMAPNSFFDVFLDLPLSSLPPQPTKILPGGGPNAVTPKGTVTEAQCPPDTSWSGNVDINWAGPGGQGQVNRHFTGLLVNPGNGTSHVHTLIFCNSPVGASWSIAGLCPGYSATLLNENFTPAPNPVPPGWTGWISVGAAASVLPGTSCCFTVTFVCDGHAGVIDVCAEACDWAISTGVVPNPLGLQFGILRTAPNPTSGDMAISFVVPKSNHVNVGIYDLAGRRVRMLFSGSYEAGVQSIRWDGRGEGGLKLAPGAYFVKLQTESQQTTKKLLISR